MSCKVFVVDDSKFMRMMLSEILESLGCEVTGVDGGRNALAMYEDGQPDLVTMDILMPEMDGIETLEHIKAMNPDAKVIMVTALGMEDYIERAMAVGACGCIIKPFSPEHVKEVLEHVMGCKFDFIDEDDEETEQ